VSETSIIDLPYAAAVEPIIGASISADTILPTQYGAEEMLVDVRLYAYQVALKALARHRNLAYNAQTLRVSNDIQILHRIADEHEVAAVHDELGGDWDRVGRYVSMANHLSAAVDLLELEQHSDQSLQARATVQQDLIQHTLTSLQRLRLPRQGSLEQPLNDVLRTGTIVVAPPGTGKTAVGAHIIKSARCTERLFAGDRQTLGALVVVPSVELVDQYASDDKDNIFREIIGWDTPVHTYWARNKQIGAITVITYRSLQDAVEQGKIKPGDFGVTFLDEVHFALGPKTFQAVSKICSGVVGATATPAYSIDRDIRKWFPHVEAGSIRDYVEQGILNRSRLFSYRYEDRSDAEDIAARLAVQWAQEGRRIIIFAQKGQHSLQARKIAMMINAALGEQKAGAIGLYPGNKSEQNLAAFKRGDLQVLTTTQKLKQGLNARANGIIAVGPHHSTTDLVQKAGRGLRRDDQETYLAELIPKDLKGRHKQVSLWEIFGIDDIQQGLLVGGSPRPADVGQQGMRRRPTVDDLAILVPPEVRHALAPPTAVRSILVASEEIEMSEEPPEDFLSVEDLAMLYGSHVQYLKKTLDAGNVDSVDVWIRQGSEKITQRWYSPNAIAYLDEHPPLRIAEEGAMTLRELHELTGLSRTYLQRLIKDNDIAHKKGLRRKISQEVHLYDGASLNRILELVEQIPFAELEDVPVAVLAAELNETFPKTYADKNGIVFIEKRRHEAHGMKGITQHVTAREAAAIREAYGRLSTTEGYLSLGDIAEEAGVELSAVSTGLTAAERAQLVSLYKKGAQKTSNKGKYLEKEAARPIIERLRLRPFPTHLVPRAVLIPRHKNIPKTSLWRYMQRMGIESVDIEVREGQQKIPCVTWQAVSLFEAVYPPTKGSFVFDYAQLPAQGDKNPQHHIYAQLTQAHLKVVPRHVWLTVTEAAEAVGLTDTALKMVVENGERYSQGQIFRTVADVQQVRLVALGIVLHIVPHIERRMPAGWVSHTKIIQQYPEFLALISINKRQLAATKSLGLFGTGGAIDVCYEKTALYELRRSKPDTPKIT